MEKNIFLELEKRGIIEQFIDRENLIKHLDEGNVPFYIGIDPTADSLHIGHYVGLMVASYLQRAGHSPLILIGGGTAAIGDPSGKTDLRRMMTREEMDENVEKIKKQVSRFVNFEGENAARIVNNADWLLNLNYKTRLETGLTFFEMGYMLLQSYDFLHLYNQFGCKLEIGGNDQWSNIIGGAELIRKLGHDDAFAFTFKLLTTKEGKKMGKTEKGALWLDKEKTSPYEFYQYWRNVADQDVENVLKMLTYLPLDEIKKFTAVEGQELNKAKKIAAYEITKLIHGEEEAKKAEEASEALFGNGANNANMPTIEIEAETSILDAIILAGFAQSKGQAKTLIAQGGITLNDNKVEDLQLKITSNMLSEELILKKGKKGFCKLISK